MLGLFACVTLGVGVGVMMIQKAIYLVVSGECIFDLGRPPHTRLPCLMGSFSFSHADHVVGERVPPAISLNSRGGKGGSFSQWKGKKRFSRFCKYWGKKSSLLCLHWRPFNGEEMGRHL